jgi:GTP1/Obg family GTP-binding protein
VLRRVNHCPLGINHMLDKIAYDYVRAIREPGANTAKIKQQLAERVKKYSEEDKTKLRELIQKWQELKK